MAFAVKYRIEFQTLKGRDVRIDIEENAFAGSITELTATGNPLEINYPNAEFEKTAGIRESKVRIRILSDAVSAADFLTTSDTQYKVNIYINNTLEWAGWLDNDILREPFLDTPEQIELSATDGLSLLKSIPLANLSDGQVWGIDRVKNFIAFALDKTELGLSWYSFINMYPAGADQRGVNSDFDAFYYSYILSHTFLEGPREFNDCYTVLSKIMQAFGCTLQQSRGAWYIVQTNDRFAGDLDGTIRNSSGTATGTALNQNFTFDIGLRETCKLINADALISWEKAFKESVIKYGFLQPPIYFRNWDLIDGTFQVMLSTATRQVYTLDNWQNVDSVLASFYGLTNDAYVGIEYDSVTVAELTRYILFYEDTDPNNDNGKTTTIYPVNKFDKINISFSRREKNSGLVTGNSLTCFVKLTAGSNYYFLDDTGKWFLNTVRSLQIGYSSATDRRFWKDFSITSEAIPENGTVTVTFTSLGHSRTANNEVHFKDINFSITTYFNEMLTVDGYQQKNEQAAVLKNKYDNQLFISNSPNVSVQGAIMTATYGGVGNWKYYTASDSTAVEFSKYIARCYWRTMYRNFIRMEGRLYDIYPGSRLLSPLNVARFTELENKEFQITTLNIDVANESAEFTMVELRDTTDTGDFTETGTEQFKYLNVRQEREEKIYEDKKPIDYKFGLGYVIIQLLQRSKRRRFNNYA